MQFVVKGNVTGLSYGGISYPAANGIVTVPDAESTPALVAAFASEGATPLGSATTSSAGSGSGTATGTGTGSSTSISGPITIAGTTLVSAASLPLPGGAATSANQPALNADGGALSHIVNWPAQQAVTAASLPLPNGAATDANLTAIDGPCTGIVAMTLDTPQTAHRAVRIICTAAGNVSLTYADGSKDVIPFNVGLNIYPGAFTTVNSAGTTATATYANMK